MRIVASKIVLCMATSDKYDRQLRLWGAKGQRALAESSVLCIGSSAAATETLKNLVLPGIGQVLIADDAVVAEKDLGINFFVEEFDRGKTRASVVAQHLSELNPDVSISSTVELPEADLHFDLVIVTTPSWSALLNATKRYKTCNRFVHILSVGFVASVRLFSRVPHVVYDSREDEGSFPDLRISNPFDQFIDFCKQFDFSETADSLAHGNIPWPVILLKAKEIVQKERHEICSTDLQSLKAAIASLRHSPDEVNFDEAIENIHLAIDTSGCPEEVHAMFSMAKTSPEALDGRTNFWSAVRAVAAFFVASGTLPLSGVIPDMSSDTKSYLQLQRIYMEKAQADLDQVMAFLDGSKTTVSREEVGEVCKLIRKSKCMHIGFPCEDDIVAGLAQDYDEEDSLLPWYMGVMGAKELRTRNGDNVIVEQDILDEIARYQGEELHTVSAVVGGVAAQEIVKLLTGLFVPLDNLFIYNGVHGVAQTVKV